MPELKARQLKELTLRELAEKLETLKAELFKLRFQVQSGNIEKPSRISEIRKTIARILTIVKEKSDAAKAK